MITALLVLALTRAEIIERFKSPVITQAGGLVKVYADCPEDLRREFQMPIANFAAETVRALDRSAARREVRFKSPGIVIHIGDVRTNLSAVVARVVTNEGAAVSRIYVPAPGFADVGRLRTEIVKGYFRRVEGRELDDAAAVAAYRRTDPQLRIIDERGRLEAWLAGRGAIDDEEGLKLMRRVFEPGRANERDVLIFASRLYLYPPQRDVRLAGRFDCLSFREALKFGRADPLIRALAIYKANDLPVIGGGRGPALASAAEAYRLFLLEFARGEKGELELRALLDDADDKLNVAFERARKTGATSALSDCPQASTGNFANDESIFAQFIIARAGFDI